MAVVVLTATAQGVESALISVADAVDSYVNIRSDPDIDSPVIGELRRGQSMPLVEEYRHWLGIQLPDGRTGYVNRRWAQSKTGQPGETVVGYEGPGITTAAGVTSFVYIRQQPAAGSAVLGRLRVGNSLEFVAEEGDWYIVRLIDGQTGYVSRNWARLSGPMAEQPAEAAASPSDSFPEQEVIQSVQVAAADGVVAYVNIRAEATTDSAVIGQLRPGKPQPLVEEIEGWFVIDLGNGNLGYVSRDWAQLLEPMGSLPVVEAATTPAMAEAPSEMVSEPVPAAAPIVDESASEVQAEQGEQSQRDRSELVQAGRLLENDRPQQAYELLSSLEAEWGGDAGFDYLFGVAALDSGRAGEAIFPLERVIRSLPDFVGARLDLARALFEIGDRERAELEFKTLLEAEPPEDVREVIISYLDAISEPGPARPEPDSLFYAVASGGYDSNANGATGEDTFLGFTLDPRSTEQGTPFVEAKGGTLLSRPLSSGLRLLWQGEAKHRHNPSADFVDHTFLSSTGAFGLTRGDDDFVAGIAAYWSALDSGFNERSAALDLGWVRRLKTNTMRLTLRNGPVQFNSEQSVRDVDRLIYTFTMRHPIQDGGGTIDWMLIGGRDDADDSTSPYSNRRTGVRVGSTWKMADKNFNVDLGFLRIPYEDGNFFGVDRDDEQFKSTFSVEMPDWPIAGWSFIPNMRYVKNKSNVPIFDYDRVEIGVSFRVLR